MMFSKMAPIAGANKAMPILENFKIESVNGFIRVTATDLGVYVVADTDVPFDYPNPVLVDANKFTSLFSALGGDPSVSISVSGDGKTLVMKKGRSSYKLPIAEDNGFPSEWQLPETSSVVTLPNLTDIIDKTLWSVSKDDLRPQMCGVYFHGNNAASTDAHKLVKISFNGSLPSDGVIVPSKSLSVIKSLLNGSCSVCISDKKAMFQSDELRVKVYSNLIDERYPNYEAVIPQHFTGRVTIDRRLLLDSVSRLLLTANPMTHGIALDFTKQANALLISSNDADMGLNGLEEIECEFEGDPLVIGLNGRFLVESLKTFSEEKVELQFTTPNKAMVLKVNDNHIILLMPVLLSSQ